MDCCGPTMLENAPEATFVQVTVGDALSGYQAQRISLGRAAELAGISREKMIYSARAAGIEPDWDEAMLAEELA